MWVEEEEGERSDPRLLVSCSVFQVKLNGTRIIVAVIIAINYSSYPWSQESIMNIICSSCTLLARGLLCSSLWAPQAVLRAEINTLPALHQRKGILRTSPPHSSVPLQHGLVLNGWMMHYFLLKTISFWAHYVIDTTRWKTSSYLKHHVWQGGRLCPQLDVKAGCGHNMRWEKNFQCSGFQMMLRTPSISSW